MMTSLSLLAAMLSGATTFEMLSEDNSTTLAASAIESVHQIVSSRE